MESLIALLKYAWLPLLGVLYKNHKEEVKDLKAYDLKQDSEFEKIRSKISHQMTKEDVNEVVFNATRNLSLEIKVDLEKINSSIQHQTRNNKTAKDSVMLETLETLKKMNDYLEKKENEK